jgi:hypothetical protein
MSPTQLSRRTTGALVLIAGILMAACTAGGSGSGSPGPGASTVASASAKASNGASSPSSAPTATASASATEPTESLPPFACTPSTTVAATTDRAQITDVRVATHEGYDRVVFEFSSGIPDAVIEGVLPPFYADPSGLEVKVSGTAFLKLTMHGASGVAPDGTVTYGGSTNFQPAFAQLVQLIEGGDFEAVSTWYLGLNGGGCTRVMTLSDPSRLVIDIQH